MFGCSNSNFLKQTAEFLTSKSHINFFRTVKHHIVTTVWGTFVISETSRTNKTRTCKIYRVFLRIKPLTGYISFFRVSIDAFLIIKKDLIAEKMSLFSCNRNLMNEISWKMITGLICFDIQTRFAWKKLSRFITSRF